SVHVENSVRLLGTNEPDLLHFSRENRSHPLRRSGFGFSQEALASGEFIAFTDDDCRPMPQWLEIMVSVLQNSPAALVGGSTVNELHDDLFAEISQLIVDLVYAHFNRQPLRAFFFASNNMGVRRNDYLDSGGFDVNFRVASEDREFCDRWRIQGRPLIWQKEAFVHHGHSQNLCEFAKLHFRYGQGAWHYQNKRRQRGSGTMREDLAFHRSLPTAVLRKTARYKVGVRGKIMAILLLWQAANAAGFFYAWLKDGSSVE
ncbi:MAG: glycosyltransferase family 2 protein, partial [Synechococcus sp.]|nr:glycosyltransferase family 2 protein [Synechococcus sp.]